jgi:hypothetical protein
MTRDTTSDPTAPPTTRAPATRRPFAATAIGALAGLGALGSLVMTLAHLDLDLPLISGLGPEGSLVPVAIGFAVGTVLYGAVAYGAFARARWAWPAALVLNAVALLATLGPPRRPGLFEPVAIAVSLLALGILVSPPGRRALR